MMEYSHIPIIDLRKFSYLSVRLVIGHLATTKDQIHYQD